jgi:adenine-specific DNA-methyltransferase
MQAARRNFPEFFAANFQVVLVDLPFWEASKPSASLYPFSIWEAGLLEEYFDALDALLCELKVWLAPTGFFIIKAAGRYRHYVKGLLDQVLGMEKFINEVALQLPSLAASQPERETPRIYEAFIPLFIYGNAEGERIHPQYKDKRRPAGWHTMFSAGQGGPKVFRVEGVEHVIDPPVGCHWKFKQETIDRMIAEGRIRLNSRGQPTYKTGESPYILDNNWLDAPSCEESVVGWELRPKIYERVLGTFSAPGDAFLHVFAGTGAGLRVAAEMQRAYVGIDPRRGAIDAAIRDCAARGVPLDAYATGEDVANDGGE